MRINVELKNLTEKGRDKFKLDLPEETLVEDALTLVISARPEIEKSQRFMMLINKELVVTNKRLEENDLLTVFPPLMGG